MIMVADLETGLILQGSMVADSEIEARAKIVATVERMFMGSQMIQFDRTPEFLTGIIQHMHEEIGSFDPGQGFAYKIGGPE